MLATMKRREYHQLKQSNISKLRTDRIDCPSDFRRGIEKNYAEQTAQTARGNGMRVSMFQVVRTKKCLKRSQRSPVHHHRRRQKDDLQLPRPPPPPPLPMRILRNQNSRTVFQVSFFFLPISNQCNPTNIKQLPFPKIPQLILLFHSISKPLHVEPSLATSHIPNPISSTKTELNISPQSKQTKMVQTKQDMIYCDLLCLKVYVVKW